MEEGREIDPHRDKPRGKLSLHKYVIGLLHIDYTMFTKWVKGP